MTNVKIFEMANECLVALAVVVMANMGSLNTDYRQPYGVKMCEEFCASLTSCVRVAYVERYLLCDPTYGTSKHLSLNNNRVHLLHPQKMQWSGNQGSTLNSSQRVIVSRRHIPVLVTLKVKKQPQTADPETKDTGTGKDKEGLYKVVSMTTSTTYHNMMHLLMRENGTNYYFTQVLNLTSCKLLEHRGILPDQKRVTPSRLYTGTCVRDKRRSCVHVLYVGSHVYISTLMEDRRLPVLRFEISLQVFRFLGPPLSCFSSKDAVVYCLTHNWLYKLKINGALAIAKKSSVQLNLPQGTDHVMIDLDSWSHIFIITNSSVLMKPFNMTNGCGENIVEIQLKCRLLAWYEGLICFYDLRLPCSVYRCSLPVIISRECSETGNVQM